MCHWLVGFFPFIPSITAALDGARGVIQWQSGTKYDTMALELSTAFHSIHDQVSTRCELLTVSNHVRNQTGMRYP